MNLVLQGLLSQAQSAAITVTRARVAVETGTNTQNIFAALEASNLLLSSVLALLSELSTEISAAQDAITALQNP